MVALLLRVHGGRDGHGPWTRCLLLIPELCAGCSSWMHSQCCSPVYRKCFSSVLCKWPYYSAAGVGGHGGSCTVCRDAITIRLVDRWVNTQRWSWQFTRAPRRGLHSCLVLSKTNSPKTQRYSFECQRGNDQILMKCLINYQFVVNQLQL